MKFNLFKSSLLGLCLFVLLTIVIGGRGLGWFEGAELFSFDFFSQKQVKKPAQDRIVIVGITDEDLKKLPSDTPDDLTIALLLEKIEEQQPIAIGLNLVRDVPREPGTEKLNEIFRKSENLYGVGKFTGTPGDPQFAEIAPPPILFDRGKVGDSSVLVDGDRVLRRGMLFPTTGESGIPSLGLLIANSYLEERGITGKAAPTGELQFGEVVFPEFKANDGGYVGADDGGYQILMNWYYLPQSFPHFSLFEVLSGNVPDGWAKDRIVLIDYFTSSFKKNWFNTPLSTLPGKSPRPAFGVEIPANLAAYLLGTVLDARPVLRVCPDFEEGLMIGGWIFLAGGLVAVLSRKRTVLVFIGASLGTPAALSLICFGVNYFLFSLGWWLPVAPSILGIWSASAVSFLYILWERERDYTEGLEMKVQDKTLELQSTLKELQSALAEIKVKQKLLIEQEKLAFLGKLTAGFCHQFKNPLAMLKFGVKSARRGLEALSEEESEEGELNTILELMDSLQEPLDRLEMLFKLILVSPTQKKISYLKAPPNKFVRSICRAASLLASFNQIEEDFEPHLDTPLDLPQQLEIPLFNIIQNAIDAVFERLAGDSEFEPWVEIRTCREGDFWKIEVSDNGGGIPPEMKDKLFEAFYTTKEKTNGTGLGLWIGKEVMDKLGGKIAVDSTAFGSKFTIFVPLGVR